jgi:hypothetical protein
VHVGTELPPNSCVQFMNFEKKKINLQIENTAVILMTIKTDIYWGFENQD